MATVVVEQVISEYELNASKYVAGSKQVIDAAHKTATATTNAVSSLASGAGSAFKGLALGAAGLALPLILAGKAAVDAALEYDTMNRSLTAIVGSAQKAKDILGFVDKLAIPSIYTTAQLGDAAKTLEAFGLTTQRYLPIAEKLGTVFGGTTDKLEHFVRALGYIKGGRFGEAFESLATGGISREALTKRGLQFDKGGEFKGSTKQALDAVEAEVNARFGKLSKEMADGPAAKMASFMDAVGRAARTAGYQILTVLVPVVEKLGDAVQNMVDKGYVEKISKSFAKLFNTKTIGDAMVKSLAGVLVLLDMAPKYIANVGKAFVDQFNSIRQTLIVTASIMGGIFLAGPMLAGIKTLIAAFQGLRASIQAAGLAAVVMEAIATGGASLAANALGLGLGLAAAASIYAALQATIPDAKSIGANATVSDFSKSVEKVMKDLNSATSSAGGSIGGSATDSSSPATNPLADIAKNTKDTADNTKKMNDVNDRILGGGILGGRGLSKSEMDQAGAFRRPGGGSRNPQIHSALMNLGRAIDMVMSSTTTKAFAQQTSRREV